MRVYNDRAWLDFNENRAGETVYVTVQASESRWNAQLLRRYHAELYAIQTNLKALLESSLAGRVMTAGEDIPKHSWVRSVLDGDVLKMFKADITDLNNWPCGICLEQVALGESETVVSQGWITGFGAVGTIRELQPAEGARIYASKAAGAWTFPGDGNATYNLAANQFHFPLGVYRGGGHFQILLDAQAIFQEGG